MKSLAFALLLLAAAPMSGPAYADVRPLSVANGKVLAGNAPANLAGVSLFWSNTGWGGEKFYTREIVKHLKDEWRASVIRIPVGVEQAGGYLDDPVGNLARTEAVIQAAIEQDMYVIVDWHSHEAELHEVEAADFFRQIASKYGQYRHVIYEIYNEPLQVSWDNTIKPYAERMIQVIRAEDKDNLIVVGTPGWSQDVDVASRAPINANNVAYALHFYADTHGEQQRDKAKVALQNKLPLFVTEWGSVNAHGDGQVNREQTEAWMRFLRSNDISHVSWAINDKAEGASAYLPNSMTLTPSGSLAKSIVESWDKKSRD
ncbi:glycoside hydrolase family 5 protein [Pigmentiphaga aceris]|uniref:Glycoside hydrolase family 5 protein n=1 Tax=Pigmentiphaga aceris TaxID=1940612 RepID=A0A5C0B1U1_9BURK|nr:glycoside hydrolase family 5 protein [Pigmentiphaga aceris]QEI06711.1 glycoside hydrolase family 5 protein [Pigmentiphaga aceris]